MIVLNFKTYREVTEHDKALHLAKIADKVSRDTGVEIVVCVQATDVYKIAQNISIPVYIQHIDPIAPGKNTGFISAFAAKQNGAMGTLLNHSEHRLERETLVKSIEIARESGLKTLVCVENATEALEIAGSNPDAIALEDPILIGGEVSIVENAAGKQKIQEFVALDLEPMELVGAGVKDQGDIRASLELGARGALLASGFDLASDPEATLRDLCAGFETAPSRPMEDAY
jgi:triosephosphate isomerase